MAKASIVVPVYHNAQSLNDLHEELQRLADKNPADVFEFVYVDDGSADQSFTVLNELAAADPRIRLVKLSRNFGSNAAILAGFHHATGDVVAVIAADLQDPPQLIHDMLANWRRGEKVVLATRVDRGDPWLTTLLARNFYRLFRRFAIRSMPPGGFDFFLIDRRVCNIVKEIEESNCYLMGLILWLGFSPTILPYKRAARPQKYGRSMWTLARKCTYFIDAFVAFSHMPVRAASLVGSLIFLAGVVYAAYVSVLRITGGTTIEGWTSLMVVLLTLAGFQLLMLGLLGEYIVRNLDETRKRPRFIVDRVVEEEGAAHERDLATPRSRRAA